MFTQGVYGKAEEAVQFYCSVFKDTKIGTVARYPEGMEHDKAGTIMFSEFKLNKQWFTAMDSAGDHKFTFNEAISFIVNCDTQEEIDYYWEKLSAVPAAEQCGWLKDTYGVSWQIVPTIMNTLMGSDDAKKTARVTKAFLQMKKFDIATLVAAAQGE